MKNAIIVLALALIYSCSENTSVAPIANNDSIPDHEDVSWNLRYYSTISDSFPQYTSASISGYSGKLYVLKNTVKNFNDPYHSISINWYMPYIDSVRYNTPVVQYLPLRISNFTVPLGSTVYIADTSYIVWELVGNKLTKLACADGYTCD